MLPYHSCPVSQAVQNSQYQDKINQLLDQLEKVTPPAGAHSRWKSLGEMSVRVWTVESGVL